MSQLTESFDPIDQTLYLSSFLKRERMFRGIILDLPLYWTSILFIVVDSGGYNDSYMDDLVINARNGCVLILIVTQF